MGYRDQPMEDVYEHQEENEPEEEEEYDENADEDFNPEKAEGDADIESSSDDDEDEAATAAAKPVKKTKKRKSENVDVELDSGDEATIKERKRRKKRQDAEADEDSGGEGGFIRTRGQLRVEKEQRKNRKYARDGVVTIDVDKLWNELSTVPIGRVSLAAPTAHADAMDVEEEQNKENQPAPASDDMVSIKRRVEFAGVVEEMEVKVSRSSKEAQRYFAEHPEADLRNKTQTGDTSGVLRPMKRPSIFEPNPLGLVKGVAPEKLRPRAPSRMDVLMAQKREDEKRKAQKLSTVQKSAADWSNFVSKEGLQDELDEYGKSKGSFLHREMFLNRAQGAAEQRARDARLKL